MNIEAEIRDLKRRVSEIEAQLVGRNRFIAPSASPSGAIKQLRPTDLPDMPKIVGDAVRDVLASKPRKS
jgi:hypothetical protein